LYAIIHTQQNDLGGLIMVGTLNCIYETPCGWCSKWDKKCDNHVGTEDKFRGQKSNINATSDYRSTDTMSFGDLVRKCLD
jgi:hypothetical protein